jgi:hypothetical protein
MQPMALVRRSRRLSVAAFAVALSIASAGVALAVTSPAITTSTPRSANDITNLDVLRQQIRNYYGDPLGSGTFASDSDYAKEATKVAIDGEHWLAHPHPMAPHGPHSAHATKAIVLDVDDTTLATWNYEIFSNWAFNPATNADFVNNERFPAVPGMVALVNQARAEGYAIFYLTGRPLSQEPPTLINLTNVGYPTPTNASASEDGLFTKPPVSSYPAYLHTACAGDPNGGTCTTIHYKSATRAHIESLGFDIVGNFGDQFSDLKGGFADRTFKLPNPNYFLP